jgi:hypothetical protein
VKVLSNWRENVRELERPTTPNVVRLSTSKPTYIFQLPWLGTLFFQRNGGKMRIVMTWAIDICEHREIEWTVGKWQVDQPYSQPTPLQVV